MRIESWTGLRYNNQIDKTEIYGGYESEIKKSYVGSN